MKWIFLTLLLLSTQAFALCPVLEAHDLSSHQIETLHKAYVLGEKQDMGYSLAAIAWKESSGGRYLINLQDPSSGVFHVTIDNALSYLKLKDTPFNRNRVAQMLINDFVLSSDLAMNNLQFWKNMYGDNWIKIWASYNAGYNWKAGLHYSYDVAHKIELIKLCHWD